MALTNNVNIDVANTGTEITIHSEEGTDTETDLFLGISGDLRPYKFHIGNDKGIEILQINNDVFTDPKTVSAGKGHSMTFNSFQQFEQVIVRTTDVTTHLEIMAW